MIESIESEDSLCMTFVVSRSEKAIGDPSYVVIHEICPTFISANSFLHAVKFSL